MSMSTKELIQQQPTLKRAYAAAKEREQVTKQVWPKATVKACWMHRSRAAQLQAAPVLKVVKPAPVLTPLSSLDVTYTIMRDEHSKPIAARLVAAKRAYKNPGKSNAGKVTVQARLIVGGVAVAEGNISIAGYTRLLAHAGPVLQYLKPLGFLRIARA